MKDIERLYKEISKGKDVLERALHTYLRATGWNHRCDTPGGRWLWQKRMLDGRDVLLCTEDAVQLQRAMIENDEQ